MCIMTDMELVAARVAAAATGCYEAPRAAALSGVPLSTLYEWARKEVVVPSISAVPLKLWSYQDLLLLRAVHWLRSRSSAATKMPEIKAALAQTVRLGLDPWSTNVRIYVDARGSLYIQGPTERITDVHGQSVAEVPPEHIDLLDVFERAPNLVQPNRALRITPGRLSGEPYVQGTRIGSLDLFALKRSGYDEGAIADMYELQPYKVREALAFEADLAA
jgi:uncharacterized protein (DUF433 family)